MKIVYIFAILSSSWALEIPAQAQIEFCGNRLRGTEIGKEEHYAKFYKCDTLTSCTYIDQTGTLDMEGNKPWRCWSRMLTMNTRTDIYKFVRVRIYESDSKWSENDYVGEATVEFSELVKAKRVTVPVVNGSGKIRFGIHWIVN